MASASPRRRELLAILLDDFEVVPSNFDESLVPSHLPPADQAVYSSLMKGRAVARANPNAVIISADTIVVIGNRILGKPTDPDDAQHMLCLLSDRVHHVYTGLAVINNQKELTANERTEVRFRKLSEETARIYVNSGEPMDKAGAYAIQGKGALLISSIHGCYYNVVGLPLYRLSVMLEELFD